MKGNLRRQKQYPGNFHLANNGVYDLSLGSDFDQIFLTEDRTIPNVRIGPISVKARNRNFQGRTSPFTVRTIIIEEIPIQKVTGLVITESLFKQLRDRAMVAREILDITDLRCSNVINNW